MPYEYKTITLHLLELTDNELNRFGQEGWKLVATLPVGSASAKLIFMRETFWAEPRTTIKGIAHEI